MLIVESGKLVQASLMGNQSGQEITLGPGTVGWDLKATETELRLATLLSRVSQRTKG